MSGLLEKIEDHINRRTKYWSCSHVVQRGVPDFVDRLLRGDVRFAKKIGNVFPNFVAENTTSLLEEAFAGRSSIKISPNIDWMDIGFILSIGPGLELVEVDDIEEADGTITLADDLGVSHADGEQVALFGAPISSISNYSEGTTTIQLRSAWKVVPGDYVAVESLPGMLSSLISTKLTAVTYLSTTPGGLYNYEVVMESGLFKDLETDEVFYLRCYPSYVSPVLQVKADHGPFLLDYLSGVLKHKVTYEETSAVTLIDETETALTGFDNDIFTKNAVVAYADVPASALLFWDIVQGAVQLEDDKFLALPASNGRFCVTTLVIPQVPASSSFPQWSIPLYARGSSSVFFSVILNPGSVQYSIYLTPGIQYYLDVQGDGTNPIEEMEISFAGGSDSEVLVSDWVAQNGRAVRVQYSIVATILGSNLWQSSSMMLKPFFSTKDDIRFRWDFSRFNNGAVHF